MVRVHHGAFVPRKQKVEIRKQGRKSREGTKPFCLLRTAGGSAAVPCFHYAGF
jgi:hypothetical protein